MNSTMIEKSIMLATDVPTMSIVARSSWAKPNIMAATQAQAPPRVSMSVRLNRLIRW